MWISRRAFNEVQRQLNQINELTAVNRAHYDERLRDKEQLIRSQEARLAVLELERRELTSILLARETERNTPPTPVSGTDPQDWESIMQAQIAEMIPDTPHT